MAATAAGTNGDMAEVAGGDAPADVALPVVEASDQPSLVPGQPEQDGNGDLRVPLRLQLNGHEQTYILTLSLQRRLIERGFSLKDATAYNLQFESGRPVFIDLGSIERPARQDLWPALGQFGPMFTFPLMLKVHHGHDLRTIFLSNLAGVGLETAAQALGRTGEAKTLLNRARAAGSTEPWN